RLVNDLGVPKTSFKATDLVIIANPVKSSDGLHRNRRITQITEVRKNWEDDPMIENGFCDLFKYNSANDRLEITDDLINGESDILKSIGSNVKQWAGNWDAIWDIVTLRGEIKKFQIEVSTMLNNEKILEAAPTIDCNEMFHKISARINEQHGKIDANKILFEFKHWYKDYIKRYLTKEEELFLNSNLKL
ncbi:MAG: hypothetical protein ACOCP8_09830, partial [archaeon]